MGVSNELFDVLSQKINEQESQILNLQAKINELTIENQKLNDENVKLKSAVENLGVRTEQCLTQYASHRIKGSN